MKDISNDISDKSELKQEFRFTLFQNAVLPAALLNIRDYQPCSVQLGEKSY